jgi:hypothetical protein
MDVPSRKFEMPITGGFFSKDPELAQQIECQSVTPEATLGYDPDAPQIEWSGSRSPESKLCRSMLRTSGRVRYAHTLEFE